MNRVKISLAAGLCVIGLYVSGTQHIAQAQIPDVVQIDILQDKIKSAIKNKEYDKLHSSIESLKEFDVKINETWYIANAEGALKLNKFDRSEASLNEFVNVYGASGWHYRKVKKLYKELALKREEFENPTITEDVTTASKNSDAPIDSIAPTDSKNDVSDKTPTEKNETVNQAQRETDAAAAKAKKEADAAKQAKKKADAAKKRAERQLQEEKDEQFRQELEVNKQKAYLAEQAKKQAEAEAQAAREREAENLRLMQIRLEQDRLTLEREKAEAIRNAELAAISKQKEQEKNRITSLFAKEVWSRPSIAKGLSESIAVLTDGTIIVGGKKDSLGYMTGLSSNGVKNWERDPDAFRSITTLEPSRSSTFYAGGTHPRKLIFGKYDASGEKIWKNKLPANGDFNEVVSFYEVSNGGVIVAANQEFSNGSHQFVFLGLDPKGKVAWQKDAPEGLEAGPLSIFKLEGDIIAIDSEGSGLKISPSTGDITTINEISNVPEENTIYRSGSEFGIFFSKEEMVVIDGNNVIGLHNSSNEDLERTLNRTPVDVSIAGNTDIIYVDDSFSVTRLTNLFGNF